MCSPETGLTFAAKISLEGKFEGRTMLYEPDRYPYHLIGPARFLWRPVESNNNNQTRTLWLWTHPAIHQTVYEQIKIIFQLSEQRKILEVSNEMEVSVVNSQDEDSPISKRRKMNESNEKIDNLNKEKTEKRTDSVLICEFNEETGIKLKSLKDQLVRFKLLGPLSTTILANVLQTIEPSLEEHKKYFFI